MLLWKRPPQVPLPHVFGYIAGRLSSCVPGLARPVRHAEPGPEMGPCRLVEAILNGPRFLRLRKTSRGPLWIVGLSHTTATKPLRSATTFAAPKESP